MGAKGHFDMWCQMTSWPPRNFDTWCQSTLCGSHLFSFEATLSRQLLNNITPSVVGSRTNSHATLHQKSWDVELIVTHYIKQRGKSNRIALNIRPKAVGSQAEFAFNTTKRCKSDRVPLNQRPKKRKSNKNAHQNVHVRAVVSGEVRNSGCAFPRLLLLSLQTWPCKAPESWQQRMTNPRKFSGCKSPSIFCAHVE